MFVEKVTLLHFCTRVEKLTISRNQEDYNMFSYLVIWRTGTSRMIRPGGSSVTILHRWSRCDPVFIRYSQTGRDIACIR